MPKKIRATIVNRLGLHARPAMSFVDLAGGFDCSVLVRKGDQEVDGKSVMQMMLLAATKGTEIEIECDGKDADPCCDALGKLVANGFDED